MAEWQRDIDQDGWRFETPTLAGVIRPHGEAHGVRSLVHRPTDTELVGPDQQLLCLPGILSTNRVASRLADLDRDAELTGDRVRLSWASDAANPFAVTADYSLTGRGEALEFSVSLRAADTVPAAELAVLSLFPADMRPCLHLAGQRPDSPAEWIAPETNDAFAGRRLTFCRDRLAHQRVTDGRWQAAGHDACCLARDYATPLAMQVAANGVAAVLMAEAGDCFAVGTSYRTTTDDDPTGQTNPVWLSLFGDDLRPGDTVTARLRLAVVTVDNSLSQPLAAYRDFTAHT